MHADTRLGRIIGALSRTVSAPTRLTRYGIQRDSTSGRLVEALARDRLIQDEMPTADWVTVNSLQHHDWQHHFGSHHEDIIDFGIGAARQIRRRESDSPRNRPVRIHLILASMLVAALFTVIHWTQFSREDARAPANGTVHAPKPSLYSFARYGYGFTSCTVPTLATMRHLPASEYRAIFVYVGGINAACAYGHLSSSWVRSVRKMGWTVFPVYVGPQSPNWKGGNGFRISPDVAAAEGRTDAADAIADAHYLGIPQNSPFFCDIEPYSGNPLASNAVLKYLSAWDYGINEAGFYAGIFTGWDAGDYTGIADIFSAFLSRSSNFAKPDALFYVLWNGVPGLSDPSTIAYWRNAMDQEHASKVRGTLGYALSGGLVIVNINLKSLKPAYSPHLPEASSSSAATRRAAIRP